MVPVSVLLRGVGRYPGREGAIGWSRSGSNGGELSVERGDRDG